jgi:glycosyltransferase involved in cell wall biosynthesis
MEHGEASRLSDGSSALQFHLLSFEGPDAYARVGGLATRVIGLAEALAGLGFETHLWFVGDPDLPGHERRDSLHLHRWCQWVSQHHPLGVYDGELGKAAEYSASLPPFLLRETLLPQLENGGRAAILAEEWQTVDAVLNLHWLLRYAGARRRVSVLWNANNTFGFERIPWGQLAAAATITTVSRYMKHCMRERGVDPVVIPNGLPDDAFETPERAAVQELRRAARSRTLLTKMARWDPDKRWLGTVGLVAEMKRQGWRPLLLARGGSEPHGEEVLAAARARRLRVDDRKTSGPGHQALLRGLGDATGADILNLRSFVDPQSRRVLFRGSDAVLANSGHEPFGLVGLEAMAAGGLACTGASGEDYAVPGQNALVLETDDPREFMALFRALRDHPAASQRLRRAGRTTARHYAWPEILEHVLLPRVEISHRENYTAPRLRRGRATAARAVPKAG